MIKGLIHQEDLQTCTQQSLRLHDAKLTKLKGELDN